MTPQFNTTSNYWTLTMLLTLVWVSLISLSHNISKYKLETKPAWHLMIVPFGSVGFGCRNKSYKVLG